MERSQQQASPVGERCEPLSAPALSHGRIVLQQAKQRSRSQWEKAALNCAWVIARVGNADSEKVMVQRLVLYPVKGYVCDKRYVASVGHSVRPKKARSYQKCLQFHLDLGVSVEKACPTKADPRSGVQAPEESGAEVSLRISPEAGCSSPVNALESERAQASSGSVVLMVFWPNDQCLKLSVFFQLILVLCL